MTVLEVSKTAKVKRELFGAETSSGYGHGRCKTTGRTLNSVAFQYVRFGERFWICLWFI